MEIIKNMHGILVSFPILMQCFLNVFPDLEVVDEATSGEEVSQPYRLELLAMGVKTHVAIS
jgi:hypothetical protein